MNKDLIGIILGILSLSGFTGLLFKGILKSKVNLYITLILIIYLADSVFIHIAFPYSMIIPVCLLVLYATLLMGIPDHFNIFKKGKGEYLLNAFFLNVQAQGAAAVNTLQIIAQTYSKGNGIVSIDCKEIVGYLIAKTRFWCNLYYVNEEKELGYLANAAIISIVNISIANKIDTGLKFIEGELNALIKNTAPEKNDIIELAYIKAKEIIKSNVPNYKAYS